MLAITRVNFQSFCRACLAELSVSETSHYISGVISKKHCLPQNICNSCYLKIIAIKEFQRKAIFSTGVLRLIIFKDNISKAAMELLSKYCRVCLRRPSNENHNIPRSQDLCTGMSECTGIQIIGAVQYTNLLQDQKQENAFKDDLRFPAALCDRCFATLKSFIEFRRVSKQTADYLENLVIEGDNGDKNDDNEKSGKIDEKVQTLANIGILPTTATSRQMQLETSSFHMDINDNDDNDYNSSFICNADTILENFNSDLEKKLSSDKGNTILSTNGERKPKPKIKCHECNLCFRKQILYAAHIKSVHEGIENAFLCPHCEHPCTNAKTLQRHISFIHKSKNQNKTYNCKYCDKAFKRKVRLKEHTSTVHQKLKPYNCSICSKEFGTKNTLMRHEKNHSSAKPFSCEYCGKRYNAKSDLNVHIQRHTGNPELLCSICKRLQPSKEELIKHFERHSKSYQCTTCGKIFKKMVNLREHIDTVHLKQKFKCGLCNLTFSARKSLKNHQLCHSSTNWPENCLDCNLYFKSKHSLLIHLKKLHYS